MTQKSELEETLAFQIKAVGLPEPEREFRFAPPRRWRFDFAFPEWKLAVEVEGGIWVQGRHQRGKGFIKDIEKYNAAVLEGWYVLRFPGRMVKTGEALNTIEAALRVIGALDG